jgi:hypothetical protein
MWEGNFNIKGLTDVRFYLTSFHSHDKDKRREREILCQAEKKEKQKR